MAAADNISSLNDGYYHLHHERHEPQQLDDEANDDDEPFYELIKQPVGMVVLYTLAYSVQRTARRHPQNRKYISAQTVIPVAQSSCLLPAQCLPVLSTKPRGRVWEESVQDDLLCVVQCTGCVRNPD